MGPLIDIAPSIVGSVTTLAVLGAIAFALRIHVRTKNGALGRDDWCMVAAVIPWAALSAICIGGALNGVGVDGSVLSNVQKETALFWFWLFEVFWCLAIIPVKLSIAFMLGRIAVAKRPWIAALYLICAMLTVVTLAGMFYIIFRCTPITYAWDTSTPGGECGSTIILAYLFYITNAVNIVTDWFCALLPIPLLWDAPLPVKAKLGVGFLLSLGVLASVAACVRQKYTSALTGGMFNLEDLGNIVIWGYAEVGIGFFVGSLSTLRPLLKGRQRRRHYTTTNNDDEDAQELFQQRLADNEQRSRTNTTNSSKFSRIDSVLSAIAKAHTKPLSRTSSEYEERAERIGHETADLAYQMSARISTVRSDLSGTAY
ncbi:hypothetical protein LTR62_007700 [Meristemomyces frigidus]|uniref:Rhodopsin domain-containing protein n=1 Tax=Meristemomyces frigidus TaxID=1508187 RepID=A0AAN7YDE3_9PEZI|nr:hypothetical protein LTR62_007700 [Meristemomyces frigidus]